MPEDSQNRGWVNVGLGSWVIGASGGAAVAAAERPREVEAVPGKGALEGVRVLEFGVLVALPMTGRILAALGADVIKLETSRVPDQMWFIPGWAPGASMPEWTGMKRRVTLDVRQPEAIQLLHELVKVSDVFITNFDREKLAEWRIDFAELQRINPRLIILWQTAMGGTGPYSHYKVYGMFMQHLCGISSMTGFGENIGVVNTSYSDYHAGAFQVMAIIGALLRRQHTGKGTLIEGSIYKAGVVTAGPALLDYSANGRLPRPMGNRDPHAAPHGAYPCKGQDRWCAIACFTAGEWLSLCRAMGHPEWGQDARFATLPARLKNADELDKLIAAWTASYPAEEVMRRLQQAGVPAGIVSQGQDLATDPHLKARGLYRKGWSYRADAARPIEGWEVGYKDIPVLSVPIGLSETPLRFTPLRALGEDNDHIYRGLLQKGEREMTELAQKGVFT